MHPHEPLPIGPEQPPATATCCPTARVAKAPKIEAAIPRKRERRSIVRAVHTSNSFIGQSAFVAARQAGEGGTAITQGFNSVVRAVCRCRFASC